MYCDLTAVKCSLGVKKNEKICILRHVPSWSYQGGEMIMMKSVFWRCNRVWFGFIGV